MLIRQQSTARILLTLATPAQRPRKATIAVVVALAGPIAFLISLILFTETLTRNLSMNIVIQTAPALAMQFKARSLVKPKQGKDATYLVFGETYRRVYQDKAGLWCRFNGKRAPVYILEA